MRENSGHILPALLQVYQQSTVDNQFLKQNRELVLDLCLIQGDQVALGDLLFL